MIKKIFYKENCLVILKQLEEKSIDMIFVDPPYKLSNNGITCENGKMVSVNKGEWDVSEGLENDYKFNLEWIEACDKVLKDDGTMWISGTYHIIHMIGYIFSTLGYSIINEITWVKPNAAPNLACRCFTASQETLLWVKKNKKAKHIFNYKFMKKINGGKQMRSVWEISTTPKREKKFGYHPTQKPKELLYRCILASTNKGDLILDPFMGSGTTGVVAIENGRNFIGIEMNEEYIKLSQKRMNDILNRDEQMNMFENEYDI